jgi:catechol 2,3-dioxygenase-like lactoylglutathione lyase family enzyme
MEGLMKLEFVYMPTRDLKPALSLYRDRLGWEEAWREGETTVSLKLPGTDVQLMLDVQDADVPAGPIFVVDSVAAFTAQRPDELHLREEPGEIPGGFVASFEDPSGNVIYVLDQSRDTPVQTA